MAEKVSRTGYRDVVYPRMPLEIGAESGEIEPVYCVYTRRIDPQTGHVGQWAPDCDPTTSEQLSGERYSEVVGQIGTGDVHSAAWLRVDRVNMREPAADGTPDAWISGRVLRARCVPNVRRALGLLYNHAPDKYGLRRAVERHMGRLRADGLLADRVDDDSEDQEVETPARNGAA